MTLIRHQVLDLIRKDILSCGFQPGEELREGELADRYSVSKSPVREALHRLSAEGLIETEPRRGHRVARISIADARDILDMRETLEAAAAKKTAREASAADLAALDVYRAADVGCARTFAAYNRRFHVGLAVVSGNRRLADAMERLLDAYARICLVSLGRLQDEDGDLSQALRDHCGIIDALQARDGRGAARVSARHIQRSRTQIMRGLERRPIIE